MRGKYTSAVYTFSHKQSEELEKELSNLQFKFYKKIITGVYPLRKFKPSNVGFDNYYYGNRANPSVRRILVLNYSYCLRTFQDMWISKKQPAEISNKFIENIKNYFKKKVDNDETESSPEGVCPNCLGKQEWEEEFYEQIKARNITPETDP